MQALQNIFRLEPDGEWRRRFNAFDASFVRWMVLLTGHSSSSAEIPEVAHQVRALKCPCLLVCCLIVSGIVIQQIGAVRGILVMLGESAPSHCAYLRYWLLTYSASVLVMPLFCNCLTLPSLLGCVLLGHVVQDRVDPKCATETPKHWQFVEEVRARGLASAVCFAFASMLWSYIKFRVRHIHSLWASVGPTSTDVIQRILADQPPEPVAPDGECAICLGDDAGLLDTFRRLKCGHVFHEVCLVEWLQRARRCPLCRLDLHRAYLDVPFLSVSPLSDEEDGEERA